jgi:uncharacterized protein
MSITQFPPEVKAELKNYVYRLIDPRNGETFYVGKGVDDRVFAHVRGELETDPSSEKDAVSEKFKRIREIHNAGFEVGHVIHRHGMDEATAFAVEAALMDAYPGLTNIAGGVGSADFGVMHADEIVSRYKREEATFTDKALLINVSRSAAEISLYEATRYAWRLDVSRARMADVILPVIQGIIVGAFTVDNWLAATVENFPDRESIPKRYAFVGKEASDELLKRYKGKRVPDNYRRRGAAYPIRYTWVA